MIIGYARVSTTEQNLGLDHDDLKPAFDASVDQTPKRATARRRRGKPARGRHVGVLPAMSLFRQGKEDEARQLAIEAASKMKPVPKDEKNPLGGNASPDD